jgi:glycosyltransferase involved in cell wall biosynthesis
MPVRPDLTLIAPYPPAGERHGGHSGVASYTANLAHGLAATGLDVEVVAPVLDGDPAAFHDGPIAVRRSFPMGSRALPAALRAAGDRDGGVVHLQFELFLYGGAASLLGLLPALAAARHTLRGRPLVTTLHQVVEPSTVDRRYTRLHRVPAPAVVARHGIAGVQSAVTRAGAATIVHEEPFRRILPAATVIPHGIEDGRSVDRAAARRALGLGDGFVVLCFGFVAPYKGIELVLEAARRAGPGIDVVVAGGEHPRLERAGFGAQLRTRYGDVARFTGWVPDGDVARWFGAADLAVFAYPRPFASSGVLALALAHGTPVLLSPALARATGAPSVVTAPMTPGPLARRIERLAADPAGLADLARWSTLLAAGRRWPAVAARHARLYEEVLDVDRHARRRVRAR